MNLCEHYIAESDLLEGEVIQLQKDIESYRHSLKYRCKTIGEKELCKSLLQDAKEQLQKAEYRLNAMCKSFINRRMGIRNYKFYQDLKNDPFFPWDGKY